MHLAIGAPIVMLRKPYGLRSARFATIVCKIEEPEDCAANESSGHPRTSDRVKHCGYVHAISKNARRAPAEEYGGGLAT